MEAEDIPAQLKEAAQGVVRVFKEKLGQDLTYDKAGVIALDAYIEEIRATTEPEVRDALITSFGAFLGEAMIATYGGHWGEKEGRWGVLIADKIWGFPFAKVHKHFTDGTGDSVRSFFTAVPALLKEY